jgi:hypothetical protein
VFFDALRDGEKDASAIAEQLGLDRNLSYRLLRALSSLELLKETRDRRFSLTEAGQLLRADHPKLLRSVTLLAEGPEHYALWKHLTNIIRDGWQNAFVREFRQSAFDYACQDPGYGRVFDEVMSSYSSFQTEWTLEALQTYDFSKFSHLCDIGGGHGHLLCSFLAKYPFLRGIVLERPSVIVDRGRLWADKLNGSDRCEYIAVDMFREIPKADAYMMKMILHDWNDEEYMQILANTSRAATHNGRVFIVEHIIPGPETPHFSKIYDIHMMCWGSGRERTVEEYSSLLKNAGWKYVQTWYPASKMIGVIEGVRT